MLFVSWNVNGLRACLNKGFADFFLSVNADIFAIQETKLQKHQLDLKFDGYFLIILLGIGIISCLFIRLVGHVKYLNSHNQLSKLYYIQAIIKVIITVVLWYRLSMPIITVNRI